MNIPTTKTIKLCDAERFCEGLRQLAIECNLDSLNYTGFGVTRFTFKDGSSIGGIRAWIEAGIITTNE